VTQFSIAGHDFYREDLEFRQGIDHGALLCTAVKDYLLQWNITGWSKQAIETAVSTLNSMTSAPPTPPPDSRTESPPPTRVQVAQGNSMGLKIKDVRPVYPSEAQHARIQGSVLLHAVINRNGDIADLEVLDGPVELVVSAVNAVRKWKYRPYMLKGNPVEVDTHITVNYVLPQ
jgi:TonB family protein